MQEDTQEVEVEHSSDFVKEGNALVEVSPETTLPVQSLSENTKFCCIEWNAARLEDKERVWAKLEILKAFNDFRYEKKAEGVKCSESNKNFVKMLNNGLVCKDAFNKLRVSEVPLPTLLRWNTTLRASGDLDSPISLLENLRFCGRKSKITQELRAWIKKLAVDERKLDPIWIYRYLQDQYDLLGEEFPISERNLQLMVNSIRKDVFAVSYGKGRTAIKDKVKLHTARINDLSAGDLYESDCHKCNLLIKSPFYAHRNHSYRYLVRPIICVWYDVATEMITGYRVSLSENKNVIKNSLMDAVCRFGIPQKIRMDNGPAYKNAEFSPHEFLKHIEKKSKLKM